MLISHGTKKDVLQWGITRSNSPKCCPNVSKTVVWYFRICKRTHRIWRIASLANASEQSQILDVLYYRNAQSSLFGGLHLHWGLYWGVRESEQTTWSPSQALHLHEPTTPDWSSPWYSKGFLWTTSRLSFPHPTIPQCSAHAKSKSDFILVNFWAPSKKSMGRPTQTRSRSLSLSGFWDFDDEGVLWLWLTSQKNSWIWNQVKNMGRLTHRQMRHDESVWILMFWWGRAGFSDCGWPHRIMPEGPFTQDA